MDALLSEDHLLLDESITAQLEKAVPKAVAELEAFDDSALWQQLADGYMLGLGMPESSGGLGSMLDASIVLAALGQCVTPAPYLGCAMLAGHLLVEAQADESIIAKLIGGELRLAVGFEPTLRRIGEPGRDAETVAFDAAGCQAGLVLDDTGALHAVALGEAVESFDVTRRVRPCLDRAEVELGDLGRVGRLELERWRTRALVATCADLAGAMRGAVQLAVEHAISRRQFGVPIGSFQALQHLIADAFVYADGARGIVNYAAWAIDHQDSAGAARAARVAKAYCSDMGKRVVEAAVQVHGGMGMTWDAPIHVYQRRVLAGRAFLGSEAEHYSALITDVED